jgi:arylsulfatase A-like enzyme
MAYIRSPEIEAGDRGVRSSFDVVPTLVELLGESLPAGLSGKSLLPTGKSRLDGRSAAPPSVTSPSG